MSSLTTARTHFERARRATEDPAIQEMARGLEELTRALDSELGDILKYAKRAARD